MASQVPVQEPVEARSWEEASGPSPHSPVKESKWDGKEWARNAVQRLCHSLADKTSQIPRIMDPSGK
jgi:hypothetical protein